MPGNEALRTSWMRKTHESEIKVSWNSERREERNGIYTISSSGIVLHSRIYLIAFQKVSANYQ